LQAKQAWAFFWRLIGHIGVNGVYYPRVSVNQRLETILPFLEADSRLKSKVADRFLAARGKRSALSNTARMIESTFRVSLSVNALAQIIFVIKAASPRVLPSRPTGAEDSVVMRKKTRMRKKRLSRKDSVRVRPGRLQRQNVVFTGSLHGVH
jgi:hypothetical protein